MKYTIAIALSATLLTGCAAMQVQKDQVASRIDPVSIGSQAQFEADVQECTTLANDRTQHQMLKTIIAGVAGAAIGAALGGAVGNAYDVDAGSVAATGAITGAASGTGAQLAKGMSKTEKIVYNCLGHRGYQLLY